VHEDAFDGIGRTVAIPPFLSVGGGRSMLEVHETLETAPGIGPGNIRRHFHNAERCTWVD